MSIKRKLKRNKKEKKKFLKQRNIDPIKEYLKNLKVVEIFENN